MKKSEQRRIIREMLSHQREAMLQVLPCDSGEDRYSADLVTRAACDLLNTFRRLYPRKFEKVLAELNPATHAWIVQRDALDAASARMRRDRAEIEIEQRRKRKAALAKLTNLDREALGLSSRKLRRVERGIE